MATRKAQAKARQALDHRLGQLRPASQWAAPRVGWIRAVRNALAMTGADLAHRLDITPAAVHQLESSEVSGTIKVATLRRAANAMDCDLVVAFVPRTSLGQTVQRQADLVLAATQSRAEHTMALEDQSVESLPTWQRARRDALIESGQLWRYTP